MILQIRNPNIEIRNNIKIQMLKIRSILNLKPLNLPLFVSNFGFRASDFIRGFTLMELLIVISVIGILVAVASASYSTAQKKSRDGRRRQDLKAIQSAFEQYYADNGGTYPSLCSVSATYLPNGMPKDPKLNVDYSTLLGSFCSSVTNTYCIAVGLESDANGQTDCEGNGPSGSNVGIFKVQNQQ